MANASEDQFSLPIFSQLQDLIYKIRRYIELCDSKKPDAKLKLLRENHYRAALKGMQAAITELQDCDGFNCVPDRAAFWQLENWIDEATQDAEFSPTADDLRQLERLLKYFGPGPFREPDPTPERNDQLLSQFDAGRKLLASRTTQTNDVLKATDASFACSKAELLRALGKHRSNTKYLEQLVNARKLLLTEAKESVGYERYLFKFLDPAEHDRVVAAIEQERLGK